MGMVTVNEAGSELATERYEQLEAGQILFFPRTPTELSEEDMGFLLRQRQSGAAFHKNIAYRPGQDVLTGVAAGGDRERLRTILRNFSAQTVTLLARLMPRYAASLRVDFTSFRPLEEAGRSLSVHARNDLLHVDAFPTRPTHGDRILRFFTNINPSQPRIWVTGDPFPEIAKTLAAEANFARQAKRLSSPLRRSVTSLARGLGLRQLGASPYDVLMHRFHNFLKENRQYQETCRKDRWEFPPRSSWMVFTDTVSHAVLSGQYALEQTFIISRHAMQRPEYSPLSVLERLTGLPLAGQN